MTANFYSATRPNVVTTTNSHVSAGNFAGTNGIAGAAGLASGRSVVRTLRVRAIATTIEDVLRVYRVIAGAWAYQFSIEIPARVVGFPGREPWVLPPLRVDIPLGGTTTTLGYNRQVNNGSIIIDEEIEDFEN